MEAPARCGHVPIGWEPAEAKGVTRSFVNRLLRLTLPSPDIQEGVTDGRQPKGMQLEERTRSDAERMGGPAGSLRRLLG